MAVAQRDLEAVRRRGFAVAYRMLGSISEAEDVAQEALLRLTRADERIDEPEAWITTVATRLSIDVLRQARFRRESYVGPWLPEPIVEDLSTQPAARAELQDSLSQAFLVMLERLTPVERAAFLLREVFGYDYAQIAAVVDRSEATARQLVTRARRHVQDARPRFDPDPAERDRLLGLFLSAAQEGDVAALERLLADDAVLYSDGGGKAAAARRPLHGGARIARAWASISRKVAARGPSEQRVRVNGQPGRVLRMPDGSVWDVLTIDVADGRIQAVRVVRNPEKLGHL